MVAWARFFSVCSSKNVCGCVCVRVCVRVRVGVGVCVCVCAEASGVWEQGRAVCARQNARLYSV